MFLSIFCQCLIHAQVSCSFNSGNLLKRDDTALVKKAKAGDDKAYDELIILYKDAVYSIIYRMVHNQQEAEDLSQEAFIKAYNSINSLSRIKYS